MIVKITREAKEQLEKLPTVIQDRMASVFRRLTGWPNVSGVKRLSGRLAGWYRIRTGDYRVRFAIVGHELVVDRIAHRKSIYEE